MTNPWGSGRLLNTQKNGVLFGWMYEDHGVELDLFPPGGRVLAIASAGDTAAALASAGHRVTAVDISPKQLRYAQARRAGAPAVTGTAERMQHAARVATRALVPAWRTAPMTRFLRLTDPEAQHQHWKRHLDRPAMRALMFAALGSARPLGALLQPGLADLLPRRFDTVLRRRLEAGISRFPNATNPWAWRLLLGQDLPDTAETGAMPAAPIEWICADVAEHLRSVPEGHYDAATLSNILDGPPPAYLARLRAAIAHGVKPGGHVVLRTFRTTAPLPGRELPDRSLLWGAVTDIHREG